MDIPKYHLGQQVVTSDTIYIIAEAKFEGNKGWIYTVSPTPSSLQTESKIIVLENDIIFHLNPDSKWIGNVTFRDQSLR